MTTTSAAELEAWRADTPGVANRNHLNNAGAGLMPRPVLDAVASHLELEAAIGGYEAHDASEAALAEAYRSLAGTVGAQPRNIAMTSSATASFVQALATFDFGPGDRILTSRCDYISNQIQFLALAARRGVEVVHVPDLPEGGIDPEALRGELERKPAKLVAVSWIPTNSGLVQDVEAVGSACERAGVVYLVDACQAVGQLPIDVGALRCDYLSATARKFLRGPRGIGFLYASDRALARGDYPIHLDMRGAAWTSARSFRPVDTAVRFEEWEQPYALVLGQGRAARYALDVGLERARERAWGLADRLRERLAAVPGGRVLDRGAVRAAIVTIAVEGWDAADLVRALTARGVNTVASRREYGIYDFEAKGVESAVRLSPHYYNTEAEVDAAARLLSEIVEAGGAR
ncbi:MAG: aminotransferase class V-fold PLP-dependent enzyme [Gemmatimonadales bacterium]